MDRENDTGFSGNLRKWKLNIIHKRKGSCLSLAAAFPFGHYTI